MSHMIVFVQNPKVESFDSGSCLDFSKESLRNGHLHTKTLAIQVAPNHLGLGDG